MACSPEQMAVAAHTRMLRHGKQTQEMSAMFVEQRSIKLNHYFPRKSSEENLTLIFQNSL
jgi:hypothetical protein